MPFKFHDLRRTAASHLGAIGCPTETIKAILNHDLEMGITGIYVHVDLLPRMREWLDRLSAHYDSLISVPVTISKVSTKAHLPGPMNSPPQADPNRHPRPIVIAT